jgi:hypothetical protein
MLAFFLRLQKFLTVPHDVDRARDHQNGHCQQTQFDQGVLKGGWVG